jgi:hypothetical protein
MTNFRAQLLMTNHFDFPPAMKSSLRSDDFIAGGLVKNFSPPNMKMSFPYTPTPLHPFFNYYQIYDFGNS